MYAEDAIMFAEETVSTLESLPAIILYQHVFSFLSPKSICRLAVCSRQLLDVASADSTWQQLCEQRGWGPFTQGVSWFQGFAHEHSKLCVECGVFTKYVFKLLACRLCEKCEFEHPKYALVTRREAMERYNLTSTQLVAVDSIAFHSTWLYLRSAVTSIAAASIGQGPSSSSSRMAISLGSSAGFDSCDGEEEEEEEGGEEGEEASTRPREDPDEAAVRRAAEKAARKAHKKQVKAEKRERRARKSAGMSSTSPLGTSPPDSHAFQPGTSPAFNPGTSPGFNPGSSPGFPRKIRGRRAHTGRSPKVWTDDLTHAVSGAKLVSGWLAERQQLMAEWGEYALSGLVLAAGDS